MDCHYLCQIKRQRWRLYENIAMYTSLSAPIASCQYDDNQHGYQVERRIELYKNEVQIAPTWNGIQRVVKVTRKSERKGEKLDKPSYYILSQAIDNAAVVAQMIQGHWSVENNLHWVKDVNLGEDFMTMNNPKEAIILAYMNNVTMNILKFAGHKPTKDTLAHFANKADRMYNLFYET